MPSTGLQMDTTCIPQPYVGSGDLNSGPTCTLWTGRKKKNHVAKDEPELYSFLPPSPWQLHLHKWKNGCNQRMISDRPDATDL